MRKMIREMFEKIGIIDKPINIDKEFPMSTGDQIDALKHSVGDRIEFAGKRYNESLNKDASGNHQMKEEALKSTEEAMKHLNNGLMSRDSFREMLYNTNDSRVDNKKLQELVQTSQELASNIKNDIGKDRLTKDNKKTLQMISIHTNNIKSYLD